MFMVATRNFPPEVGGMQNLIEGLSNALLNQGPAHIASHLDKKGLALFGGHTSAKKVSIENFNFKPLSVKDLKDLKVETVISEVRSKLN